MKKAFDQTVRDLKRGVNKKVLKVPSIEQKVLDATSNEPWGPHGALLADIAQATRNYHEYQIIMSVIWKRINDTGKNWRHVYKALTVLEYLVAHGSERIIDDIREHAYQISTLSDFQYIDSSGRDQGNNVRKKSQSLVVLVNDKERIQEVRDKAAANRDRFRNERPGYEDRYNDDRHGGRYGNRDDDRDGYGRDRDWGSRDDDRYGREGERYGREYGERFGPDGYRDDDYRGRGQNTNEYNYNSRSRSADRVRDRSNEDDGQFSSRGSGAKADDHSQDGRSSMGERPDNKYSGQNHLSAPPSYEDVVSASRSPTYSDRDGESSQPNAPKELSPPGASPHRTTTTTAPVPAPAPAPAPAPPVTTPASSQSAVQQSYKEVDGFGEFDPRGSFSAAPTTSSGTAATLGGEMDFLGSSSDPFSSNPFALVTASQPTMNPETNASATTNSGPTFTALSSASTISEQPFDDPFGDGPFKAVPSNDSFSSQSQITTPANDFKSSSNGTFVVPQPDSQKAATEFGGPFHDGTYMPPTPGAQPLTSTQLPKQQLEVDILADILPSYAPSPFPDTGYSVPPSQPAPYSAFPQTNPPTSQPGLSSLTDPNISQSSFQAQAGQPAGFPPQLSQTALQSGYPHQSTPFASQAAQNTPVTFPAQAGQVSQMGFHSQSGSMQQNTPYTNFYGRYNSPTPSVGLPTAYMVPPNSTGHSMQQNLLMQSVSANPVASQMIPQAPHVQSTTITPFPTNPPSTASAGLVPQSSKDKFETKSSIWADTLSRGLVNLNISGSKINPNADIGVDFDAINRKEKRMEKPTAAAAVTSTVTMGKAMGSGSGVGRAGASALRAPPNPMMGPGMNIGMGGGPGGGMGMMGSYGVNQPVERGMGMGMGPYGVNQPVERGMGMGMGPGMNMGMRPGMNMQQQPMGFRGPTMPGGYSQAPGMGNYGQQPYGGGHQ